MSPCKTATKPLRPASGADRAPVLCPLCGRPLPVWAIPEASARGIWVKCKNPACRKAEADLLQAKEEGEVLKKQASEKTEQETEALKALAQGKEEEAVSAIIKALL